MRLGKGYFLLDDVRPQQEIRAIVAAIPILYRHNTYKAGKICPTDFEIYPTFEICPIYT
jgi:hypothetical protein